MKKVVKELLYMAMVINIKENLKTENLMDKEFIIILMEKQLKVIFI